MYEILTARDTVGSRREGGAAQAVGPVEFAAWGLRAGSERDGYSICAFSDVVVVGDGDEGDWVRWVII